MKPLNLPKHLIESAEPSSPRVASKRSKSAISKLDTMKEGSRDNDLFRAMCSLVSKGLSKEEADSLLWVHSEKVGFPRDQFEKCLESAFSQGEDWVTYKGTEITASKPRWLIQNLLQKGALTLLSGNMGTGKTYCCLALASALSNGSKLPNGFKPTEIGNTAFMTVEDRKEQTMYRYQQQNGDPERLTVIPLIENLMEDIDINLSQPDGLKKLANVIERDDIKLVVIDPLNSMIGDVDPSSDQSVRSLLGKLMKVAYETDVSIIFLIHHGKKDQRDPEFKTLGSVAYVAVPRTVIYTRSHPNNKERRLFDPFKVNDIKRQKAWEFSIEKTGLVWGDETEETYEKWDSIMPERDTEMRDACEEAIINKLRNHKKYTFEEIQKYVKSETDAHANTTRKALTILRESKPPQVVMEVTKEKGGGTLYHSPIPNEVVVDLLSKVESPIEGKPW